MSIYEEKHALYREYIKELNTFSKPSLQMDEKDAWKNCEGYILAKDSSWHNIYDPESKALVGFLIIGKEYPEKHRDALRSVSQAYVLPQFRRKGLMTAAMSDYLTRHKGVYSILILKRNEYARRFWRSFFTKEGYKEVALETEPLDYKELILVGYAPED